MSSMQQQKQHEIKQSSNRTVHSNEAQSEYSEYKERGSLQNEESSSSEDQQLIRELISQTLTKDGYNPPDPPPLVEARVRHDVAALLHENTTFSSERKSLLIRHLAETSEVEYREALAFFDAMVSDVKSIGFIDRIQFIMGRVHSAITKATITICAPAVEKPLQERMRKFESFCSTSWDNSASRSAVSVHADIAANRTIIQLCIAKHGPVYITIPGIISPEEVAHNTIRALIGHADRFNHECDPVVVLDGEYPSLNFNGIFSHSRVIRAPSGNIERLQKNIFEARNRERLERGNTRIINGAPTSVEEYRQVFPSDQSAASWSAWTGEAELWKEAIEANGFAAESKSSHDALMAALTESKNVIVIVAHSDGDEIFMPDGEPVSINDIKEKQDLIRANQPFVYLFVCEGAQLEKVGNFASTLLEAGACGVVASQTQLGGIEGRGFLGRLLGESRGKPPIEDVWATMKDMGYHEMEVFLA